MLNGATFKKTSRFFRPTAMSLAMAKAGIIPGTHLVAQQAAVATLRSNNDNLNIRRSVRVAY
jgi:hypothetical protein